MDRLHVEAWAAALLGTLMLVLGTVSGCGSGPAELPVTPLAAPFAPFAWGDEAREIPFDPSRLPVDPDSVEARWYVAGGLYVLFVAGLDPALGLCLNAQSDGRSFIFPTQRGACAGGPPPTLYGGGVRRCGRLAFFVTDIPADAEGELWARVLSFHGRDVIGVFSSVDTSDGPAPEIDLESREWAVRPGEVLGAAGVVEC